jgi:hypothetical protein
MIETKVTAASFAALVTGLIVNLILSRWPVLKDLNEYLTGIIMAVITAGLTFLAGWWAKHTPRPDIQEQ